MKEKYRTYGESLMEPYEILIENNLQDCPDAVFAVKHETKEYLSKVNNGSIDGDDGKVITGFPGKGELLACYVKLPVIAKFQGR